MTAEPSRGAPPDAAPGPPPGRAGVLFVHPSDEAYGADRVLLDLALGLRERGWEPRVVLPREVEPGWLAGQLVAAGIPVDRLDLAVARRRNFHPLRLPAYIVDLVRARAQLRRIVRTHRPAIIHINTSALLVGALLGRPAGARVVWHVHELVIRPRLVAALFRVLPPITADRVVAVSDAVRRHLWSFGPLRRPTTIHNGLPDRIAHPLQVAPPDKQVVAFVGRVNRWKGHEVFVEAAALIAERHADARFVIAGDAPAGEEDRSRALNEQIRDLGLGDVVTRLGFVSDGAAVLDASDVAVVPSVWPDPFPTVILEAMRSGCVVVASNHGGAPEMIEDGVSGILVEPGSPRAVATGVGRLLADPQLRARMAAAGRARVDELFPLPRMVAAFEALYRDVVR